jgi:Spy/CpxP family protein refolding chaperone
MKEGTLNTTISKPLLLLAPLLVVLCAVPHLSAAQPGSMMQQMDQDTMERMMGERGYGFGYGYGYGGRGPMGSMSPMMGQMMGPMGHMMGNLHGLNLTDKQRDQIRDIQRNMRKQHWDLMEKMMETSDKLEDLYDVEKPDAEKIGKVYDEIYKIKRQMIQQHIEIRNKIYDILTKEQQEKFKANDPFAHRFGMMY